MKIWELVISTIVLPFIFFLFFDVVRGLETKSISQGCKRPVVEYTTGELDEIQKNLYSDSVEWEVIFYFPIKSTSTSERFDDWVVIIKVIADGDEALEDFVEHPQSLAQVKVGDQWVLQRDFERALCEMPVP